MCIRDSNYINLIIHEAVKMQPSESHSKKTNAAERVTAVFLELLERQFPIESTERPLELKTAQDFAKNLFVHVNYLNSSVTVSYTHLRAHETPEHLVCRLLLEKK